MSIKIALAGNPNCGKTTMFNDLTGSNQYVGNWPGVTVEKKEGKLKGHKDVIITDLPGIYSLSPYTLEEVVSRNYLLQERPDAVIDLVDGTNLERNLYLTTQILELGIPVVVAVNMIDLVQKNGDKIDIKKLSDILGCEVVETSALRGKGSMEAAERAIALAKQKKAAVAKHEFSPEVEGALDKIATVCSSAIPKGRERWYAVKLLEQDEKLINEISLSDSARDELNETVRALEEEFDDDGESIITNERYEYIAKVMQVCVKKKQRALTNSDKIDRIVTNRWLALPIFAVVMFLVYYISVTTVGTVLTDWANDGVFGDGWRLLGIGTSAYEEAMSAYETEQAKTEGFLAAAEEEGIDTSALVEQMEAEEPDEAALAAALDAFLAEAADVTAAVELEGEDGEEAETLTVSAADFKAAAEAEEPDPSSFGLWIPGIPALIERGLEAAGTAEWLNSLILDGIVGGVGAVLGFVPQMIILFLLLSLLEQCGYMARVAFIMDRIFRKFGLSGKSFIPMLISSGCGVPGVMATKTIENEKDRRMTVMTTTFIPCGAKLPVIALIAGAILGGAWWLSPVMYFVGIAAVILSGIILKKTKMFAGDPAPFVMELPQYHLPAAKSVLLHVWERCKHFITKAGTIIFVACALIWFLSSFGWTDGSFGMAEEESSILAAIGHVLAPLFAPLGFGNWRSAVATVSGLVAKENVVGTLGVLNGIADAAEDNPDLWVAMSAMLPSAVAGISFLVFNLLCAPCFAAIGAIRREMSSAKWTAFAIGYQTVFAYAVSFLIYQFGTLFTGGGFGIGTVFAIFVLAAFLFLLLRPNTAKARLSAGAVARA